MIVRATRRELLAALGALAVAPGAAVAAPASLRSILDGIAATGEPAAMLALVRRASAGSLERVDRSILRMVTRGLERDVELRRRFPFGKPDGSSPYVLS